MKNSDKKIIELEELKKIQIEILDYVHNFCLKNEIKYWIDCGTLLGAIRHKGYIPWDDDIDVGMLRPDFDKFIRLFNNNGSKYELHCYENDKDWHLTFAKVYDTNTILYQPDEKTGTKICVNIDIFVYDNAPDDIRSREKKYRIKELYRKLNSIRGTKKFSTPNNQKFNVLRYPLYYILKVFPKDFFLKKSIKVQKKYDNIETMCIGNYSARDKMICNKHVFDSFIDVDFENKKYKAPVGYDEYLKAYYGDYMKLPPVEKRVSHHMFVAYYKEKRYK